MDTPETRYAKSGDVNIAYQVLGDGPVDMIHVPAFISNLELQWEDPAQARYLQRLASFSRLIMFDKRGTGLSDRSGVATLEERMDDVRAVMDHAGSERAVVFGSSEGGALSILFAATYPERTSALVLYGAYARMSHAPDYPDGVPTEMAKQLLRHIDQNWGRGGLELQVLHPGQASDERARDLQARWERLSASPSAAVAIMRMIFALDVRHLLPDIHVPSLVVYRTSDVVHAAGSRYIGTRIPDAKVVELPGDVYFPYYGDQDAIIDEIEEFVTGVRPVEQPDRVLATVLFTDIVGSTEKAAELGDRKWRELLEAHHSTVRRELERHRGREVDTAGDGFLATFDGPARAVRCACSIRDAVHSHGLEIRAGVHTGEIELRGDDVAGIAVHVGSRVSALAGPGEILVSSTVVDLVAGSGLEFNERGEHELKGVPRKWTLYEVVP